MCIRDRSATVRVPKASMHLDSLPAAWERDIRPPRQVLIVGAEAVSEGVQKRPDDPLRLGVPSSNGRHVAATPLRAERIDHYGSKLPKSPRRRTPSWPSQTRTAGLP